MADNAIDKLIEETRNAYAEVDRIDADISALEAQHQIARDNLAEAKKRCRVLDLTMKKHIHENMPIVQAKMVAHEEIAGTAALQGTLRNSWTMSALQSAQTAINAQLVSVNTATVTNGLSLSSI